MNKIYWLDQIKASERPLVGEKAFSLSQIQQKGYGVKPGFVISTATFKGFLEKITEQGLLRDFPDSYLHVDIDNYQALQICAQKTRQEIIKTPLPSNLISTIISAAKKIKSSSLILRSSIYLAQEIKHNYQGLFPGIDCWCNQESLDQGIKKAWAELFRAKSIYYWAKKGITLKNVHLALLIQPLHEAIASGTIEIDSSNVHIQATRGLGNSIVKGEVKPDYYQINRSTGQLATCNLGSQPLNYRLKQNPEPDKMQQTCLEIYLPNEAIQKQFTLNEDCLSELKELSLNLAADYPNLTFLEWVLLPGKNKEQEFYLTQSSFNLENKMSGKETITKESQLLLTGLGTAKGQAIAEAQIISGSNKHWQTIPPGKILVTNSISPDWLPVLRNSKGIVSEVGGITSHAAIIARELGIPAIVGAADATKIIKTGESILINGDHGTIYRLGSEKNSDKALTTEKIHAPLTSSAFTVDAPAIPSYYPIATQLMVNLSQPSSLNKITNLPLDGIGLLRSELMLLDLLSSHPLEYWLEEPHKSLLIEKLTQLIAQFASAFAPRPIFYRCLDWNNSAQGRENNVLLRGTYHYLVKPELLDLQLEALARIKSSGYTNVNLIFPFIRSVEEFIFCRSRVEKIGLNKAQSRLWIMAEVPSVMFLLPEYVKAGVQGIALGTNDLTQLMLGIDREQTLPSELNAVHPAMLAAIKQLIESAQNAGIPCSICGQATVEYPELVEKLVRWGISSISVELEAVGRTYQAIARAEQKLLLEAARQKLNIIT